MFLKVKPVSNTYRVKKGTKKNLLKQWVEQDKQLVINLLLLEMQEKQEKIKQKKQKK